MSERLTLEWLPGRYAVCRLEPGAPIPTWALDALQRAGPFSARSAADWQGRKRGENAPVRLTCITRSEREVAVVIDESLLPAANELDLAMPIQRGFVALRIVGALDFSLVGILAKLTGALAAANVSVFVLCTYDTDITLVRETDKQRAIEALREVASIK